MNAPEPAEPEVVENRPLVLPQRTAAEHALLTKVGNRLKGLPNINVRVHFDEPNTVVEGNGQTYAWAVANLLTNFLLEGYDAICDDTRMLDALSDLCPDQFHSENRERGERAQPKTEHVYSDMSCPEDNFTVTRTP